jgi:hypothetical protein
MRLLITPVLSCSAKINEIPESPPQQRFFDFSPSSFLFFRGKCLFLPFYQEETGSHMTAHTTTQSPQTTLSRVDAK